MQGIKQIEQRLTDVKLLEELTSTFEAIAAQNLAATRNRVLSARDFLEEARQVYTEARDIYIRQHQLDPGQYQEQLRVFKDNGKELVVVIAPNTKLYGALPDQLLSTATEGIRGRNCDVLVLGKVGVDHFSHLRPPIPFESIEVADEDLTVEQVQVILGHVSRYHRVTAYYNHFRTVLTADVLEAELTLTVSGGQRRPEDGTAGSEDGNQKAEDGGQKAVPERIRGKNVKKEELHKKQPIQAWMQHIRHLADGPDALFEPSLEEVLNFFETIILKTLLRQKVHESLLSRYAARMVAMDIATENAKKVTKQLTQDLRRAKRRKANAKMLDNYSGMTLWKN